jgi:hypothetical protein
MVLRRLAMAFVLSNAVVPPALAKEAPGLPPDSPWNLVYDDDSCALRRTFADGDRHGYFEMRRFGPDIDLQVMVASESLKARDVFEYRYRWGDEPEWREAGRLKITLDGGLGGAVFGTRLIDLPDDLPDLRARDLYLHSTDWRALEQEAAARIESISMRGGRLRGWARGELTLELGSMRAPMAALNSCIDELVTHWGIDIEAHKTLTRPALPIDMAAAASMVGYPPKMLRQFMPGLVNVRLAIDETGLVTACRIQMPLSDPEFEASSCADIQHAFEFEPALDKDGKPIASYWITRVVFQIAH